MTIDLVNVLDSKCLLRMLEMAFQSIKISKLSRGAGPHPLAAHAFGSHVIHRWLKNIPILHTQKVEQSAITMAKILSLAAENALFTLPLPLPKGLQKDLPQLEGG